MKYVFVLGFSFFACFAFWMGWSRLKAKRLARHQPLLEAVVVGVENSKHERTHTEGDRYTYEVKVDFDVTSYGSFFHRSTYRFETEAREWAARFPPGSRHRVKINLINQEEVFLEGEENKGEWMSFVGAAGFLFFAAFSWFIS